MQDSVRRRTRVRQVCACSLVNHCKMDTVRQQIITDLEPSGIPTILISPWTNAHLDPPTAESMAKFKIALAELTGSRRMQQKDVCGSWLLYREVQVLAALQLYKRQMNPIGKVRGKSALGFTQSTHFADEEKWGDLDISVKFISPTDIKSSQLL